MGHRYFDIQPFVDKKDMKMFSSLTIIKNENLIICFFDSTPVTKGVMLTATILNRLQIKVSIETFASVKSDQFM